MTEDEIKQTITKAHDDEQRRRALVFYGIPAGLVLLALLIQLIGV